MSLDLVNPPPRLSPQASLSLSQKAPQILKSSRSTVPWPLSLLFPSTDTPEHWSTFENLFISCLRTGDDDSALQLLTQLRNRFGDRNERVTAYQAMYDEVRAKDEKGLIEVMKAMGDALEADPTNLLLQKRRIALLRSMGRLDDATKQLVDLLQVSPIDAEAWAELADLYLVQALYEQSVYCLEEVLLITPNAWNMHAKLGEVIYLSALANIREGERETAKVMAEALRRFCRSVELCDNYLRGFYGLKMVSKRLLDVLPKATSKSGGSSDSAYSDLPLPAISTVQKLHELATSKLAEIVRRGATSEKGWDGYDEAELIAARELLDRDTHSVPR